jgi:hypothetical protein
MRSALGLLMVLVILPGAGAQPAGERGSGERLGLLEQMAASASPEVRAWSAFMAARDGLKDAVPVVRRLLAPLPLGAPEEARFVQYAALDALIRLDADVPAQELLGLPDRFVEHAIILLARHPDRNQAALLEVIRKHRAPRDAWIAVCNLLVPRRTPGLAAWLLGKLERELRLHVHDPGSGYGGGVMHSSSYDGRFKVPRGYPPTTLYRLTDRKTGDAELLAPGRRPIFVTRRVVPPGETAGFGSHSRPDEDYRLRVAYLADLAGVAPSALDLPRVLSVTIHWYGPERFLAEAARARADAERQVADLCERLASRGSIPTGRDGSALVPELRVTVKDARSDRSTPLPELPAAGKPAGATREEARGNVRIGDVDWFDDYDAALAAAKAAGKPLFVHFGENPG